MKKFVLGILLTLSACITFGNTTFKKNGIADWDKPLKEKRIFNPSVLTQTLTIIDEYHVVLRTELNGAPIGSSWTMKVYANATWYILSGFRLSWQPVTYLWSFDITIPSYVDFDEYITLPRRTQWVSNNGNITVAPDQFATYEIDPL